MSTNNPLPVDNFLNGLNSFGSNLNRVNTSFPGFYTYMSELSNSVKGVGSSINKSGKILNSGLENISNSFSSNLNNINNRNESNIFYVRIFKS